MSLRNLLVRRARHSEFSLTQTWRAGIRDHVADVVHTGAELHHALKAQPESRVRHAAITPQILVWHVIVRIQPALSHGCLQHIEPFLALAAADDFPYLG